MYSNALPMKENKLSLLLLQLIMLIIAFRPIIDLQGRFDGESLNMGGAAGLVLIAWVALFFLMTRKKSEPVLNVALYAMLFIAILWLINLWFTPAKGSALVDITRFAAGFSPMLLLYCSGYMEEHFPAKRFYTFYILVCIVPMIIAFLQYLGVVEYTYFDVVGGEWVGRSSGGYIQPSSLSRLMIFSVLLSYIFYSAGQINALTKYSVVLLSLFITVLSTHRTSTFIIAVIMVSFELYALVKDSKQGGQKKIMIGLNTASLLGIVYLINLRMKFFSLNFIEGSLTVMTGAVGTLDVSDDSFLRGRGYRWQRTLEYMSNLSTGEKLVGKGHEVFESHNDIINMYLVSGLVGLLLYFILYTALFVYIWRGVNPLGRFSLIILYTVIILFGITLQPSTYPNFMWMFFATLIVIKCLTKKSDKGLGPNANLISP